MTADASAAQAAPAVAGKDLFGHPRGLWYLSFAEAWERFSYYGMNALLVLYLSQYLLLPGHIEHVAGFGAFKGAIDPLYRFLRMLFGQTPSPLVTPIAIGTAVTAVYTSGVYVTPIIGGLIADRLLGRTATVTIGALLMVIGHFLMAFEVSFVAAILCLFIGVGCFKGNIASQVGELYPAGDLRRASAYQVYMLGIQIAVIFAPTVCSFLAGSTWHWGFAAAGFGMLIGLTVYLSGRKYLPPEPPRGARAKAARVEVKLSLRDWFTVTVLVAMLPALALSAIGNQEIFNAYEVWGDAHYNLNLFGFRLPVPTLISVDAIISTFMMFGVIAFWKWYSTHRKEPDEIVKILIGTAISACGPLLLAAGSAVEAATGQKVSLLWGIGFHLINDIGFSMVFPVGLALYSRASPKGLGGLVIGIYYLHLFMANLSTGVLGGMLETMSPTQFWLMHSGLVALGGGAILVFALLFHRLLAPTEEPVVARVF
ncbi:MAG: MFS transporter [Alphaproteobacteria bacterium]